MDWYYYPIIIGSGLIAGFINTLAGSGSLVTLPVLIFLGLPANIANGTNRIAILLQNVIGVTSFRQLNILDIKGVYLLGIPALLGSLVGASIAVNIDEATLKIFLGIIMTIMLFVILYRPNRWLGSRQNNNYTKLKFREFVIFFTIGIYGGFIQAGVGILLLSGLVLGIGYDLVRANAVKVGIVLLFTVGALSVFIVNKQIDWGLGLTLAIGNMLGARIAVRTSAKKGAVWARRLLILIVSFSAIYFLGVLNLLRNIL